MSHLVPHHHHLNGLIMHLVTIFCAEVRGQGGGDGGEGDRLSGDCTKKIEGTIVNKHVELQPGTII